MSMSESQGKMIWGPLWTTRNLYNRGPNAGLPAPKNQEPTTARGRRRKQK